MRSLALVPAFALAVALAGCGGSEQMGGSGGSSGSSGGTGGSTGGSGGSGGSSAYDAAAQACVDYVNKLRAQNGLHALQRWTSAEACTGQEAQKDSAANKAHSAFGSCGESAQCECPGWPGPVTAQGGSIVPGCLDAMWSEGPPPTGYNHYSIMNGDYTKVACGFYTTGSGAVWAAQNYQ